AWALEHVRGDRILATPRELEQIRSVYASYEGHFRHANSYRLQQRIRHRFPWLETALLPRASDHVTATQPLRIRWELAA
ncbi:MAG: hypothetical protein ACRD3Q_03510, partial [Terriglobales bacterium]